MTMAETVFGLLSIGLFSTAMFYNLKILDNFQDHEEISVRMFFLDDRGPLSFQILVSATIIYSLGMLYASLGVVYNQPLLSIFSKGASLILFVVLVYFLRTVSHITEKKSNAGEAEEKEIKNGNSANNDRSPTTEHQEEDSA